MGYLSCSSLLGAEFQFFRPGEGPVDVSFPYSVTDASGVTNSFTFAGRKAGVYARESSYIVPIGMEFGSRHYFITCSIGSRIVQGRFLFGTQFEGGLGYFWFFDPARRIRDLSQKRWVIKVSLNVNSISDGQNGKRAILGSIDNAGKTIHLLGINAGPTFIRTTRRNTTTYNVRQLDISYSQQEVSLLPKIGIANNPYHRSVRWELNIGYNFPLTDLPGLYLNQVATDGTQNALSGVINIHRPGVVASYNGKPIGSAPFRFSGLFLQFVMKFGPLG